MIKITKNNYVKSSVLAPAGAIFTIRPASVPRVDKVSRKDNPAAKAVRSSACRAARARSFSSEIKIDTK